MWCARAAHERHLDNITTARGAETLPFADNSFEVVISRYSAHHWHDVAQALREVKRVLEAGGKIYPDGYCLATGSASAGHLAANHRSAARSFACPQLLSGRVVAYDPAKRHDGAKMATDRLALEYNSWVERMKTPEVLRAAIRYLQNHTSEEVKQHFRIRDEGSFTSDTLMFQTRA